MTREDALEIIRKNMPSDKSLPVYEALQTLIPELKESEDERIRKAIIHYILYETKGAISEATEHTWVKWLEKQKERKPAEWSAKGRRGRIGSTPEHIRKKAENFLSKMEPPYDADDICSAYETGAMENANSSWSEEDEKMLRTIISDGSRGVELDSKQISWLKSLRPSWKPSEEQMKALEDAFRKDGSDEYRRTINSLYQQLKRL